MILEIPLDAVPAQVMTVQLGDNKYIMDVQWNDRGQYPTLSLSDAVTEQPIAQGLPMVLGVDLLNPYNFGIGTLIMVDTSGRGQETTVSELGKRVKMYWVSEDEVDGL